MIILVAGMFYYKIGFAKTVEEGEPDKEALKQLMETNTGMQGEKRLFLSIKVLTLFYLIISVCDWFLFGLTQHLESTNLDVWCLDNTIQIVRNNMGALYMLIFAILIYSYSFIMIYIFYILPAKEGLVGTKIDFNILNNESEKYSRISVTAS